MGAKEGKRGRRRRGREREGERERVREGTKEKEVVGVVRPSRREKKKKKKKKKRKILTLRSRRPAGSRAASRQRPRTCGAFRRAPLPGTRPGQGAGERVGLGRGREREIEKGVKTLMGEKESPCRSAHSSRRRRRPLSLEAPLSLSLDPVRKNAIPYRLRRPLELRVQRRRAVDESRGGRRRHRSRRLRRRRRLVSRHQYNALPFSLVL